METFFSMRDDYVELVRECNMLVGKRILGVRWLFKDTQIVECCDPGASLCQPQRRGEEERNWFLWLWTPDWVVRNHAGVVVATRPTPQERSVEFGSLLIGAVIEVFEINKVDSSIVVSLSNGNCLCTGPCIDGADAANDEVCWMVLFPSGVALEVGYNGQRWKRVVTKPRTRKTA